MILGAGVAAIAEHDQRLVQRLIDGLDPQRYRLVSAAGGPSRSTLVVVDVLGGQARERHERLAAVGVDVAHREGNLRLCPHLFTTADDIDRALQALHDEPGRRRSPDRLGE